MNTATAALSTIIDKHWGTALTDDLSKAHRPIALTRTSSLRKQPAIPQTCLHLCAQGDLGEVHEDRICAMAVDLRDHPSVRAWRERARQISGSVRTTGIIKVLEFKLRAAAGIFPGKTGTFPSSC
jgi:hypothetical protein